MSDASCRLIGVFFDILEDEGISPEVMVEGTDLQLEDLRQERNWIGWDELCHIAATVSALVGGDAKLHALAADRMLAVSSYGTLRSVSQMLASPKALYRTTARWISSQLFSMIEWTYEDLDARTVTMTLRYEEPYAVMPQLPALVGASLVTLPGMLGLPRAELDVEVTGRVLCFTIRLPLSRTLWSRVVRMARAVFSPDSVIAELELQAERLRAQNRALAEARAQEERLLRARYLFLTSISHELRTPLSGILGSNELLLAEDLPPSQRELALAGQRSAERLSGLLETVLDFNQAYIGELDLKAEEFSLEALLSERLLAAGLSGRGRVSAPEAAWVCGDVRWLSRALDALLDNVARFAPEGPVEVTAERRGALWRLSVQDSGPGMSAEQLRELFEPLSASRAYADEHLGLGLAMVRHTAEAMGGSAGGTSSGGLRVWMDLPLASAQAAAPAEEEPPVQTRGSVLLVEDNTINQLVVGRLLESLGFEVAIASDGAEGVRLYQEQHYVAVLMDIQMPVMDGHEATCRIRALQAERSEHVPILALTAHASSTDREKAFAAGVDDYLTKPTDRRTLGVALGSQIDVARRWTEMQARAAR